MANHRMRGWGDRCTGCGKTFRELIEKPGEWCASQMVGARHRSLRIEWPKEHLG